MIYDKDYLARRDLFKADIQRAVATYKGHTALQIAEDLRIKRDINNTAYLEVAYLGLNQAIREGSKITELRYIHDMGFHHYKLGDYDEAFMYYAQGMYISEAIRNKEFIARFQIRIGEIYMHRVNYDQALDSYFKVLRYDDDRYCNEVYSNIAELYKQKEDFNVALDYSDKAISYNQKTKNYNLLVFNLIVTGNINFTKKKYGHALEFYAKALKISDVYDSPYFRTMAVMRSGDVLFKLGHYSEASGLYEYASEMSSDYGFKYLNTICNNNNSKAYSEKGEYGKAIVLNKKALEAARAYNYELLELHILRNARDYAKALKKEEEENRLLREIEQLQIGITLKEQQEKLALLIAEKERELEFFRNQDKALAAVNNDLKQFAKITSHDLKEPLRTITSFANLLQKQCEKPEKENIQEYFKHITEGTNRMSNLLDDLLHYMTLGIADKNPVRVNLQEIVTEVLESFENKIKAKKIKVSVSKLPVLMGRKEQFRDLFYQLIDNSIKFNKHEKPILNIAAERDGMKYLFGISDNGVGVESDYHQKIFLIFHKLEQTDKKSTGIGLAVCKKIVELHGGNIWISSKKGEGTKIEFTLSDV